MASTDENHDVRLLGLESLQEIIEMFKFAKEPEIENGISSISNLEDINIFTQNEMFGINSQKKYFQKFERFS